MPPIAAILPLKSFGRAKERLALPPDARREFAAATARVVAGACARAGLDVVVVAGDTELAGWARDLGAEVVDDPRAGLNAAADAGVDRALATGRRWIVVHGDLPLLGPGDVADAAAAIDAGAAVLAPSRDGGTNLLASPVRIAFGYGPGSFARHVAAVGGSPRLFLARPGTAVEVDTYDDLAAAAALPGGEWLEPHLRAAGVVR